MFYHLRGIKKDTTKTCTISGGTLPTPTPVVKHSRALCKSTLGALMLSALLLGGCISPEQMKANEEMANSVITALPTEVQGCTFLGEVDARPRMSIATTRYELKILAAKLGATHVVETLSYPQKLNRLTWDYGVALTGRAYLCPEGLGPKVNNPQGELKMPDHMPQPTLNSESIFFQ